MDDNKIYFDECDVVEDDKQVSDKEIIEHHLRATKRLGIEELLEYMDKSGFYTAPASTRFHGAYEGALAKHSINVLDCAMNLAHAWLDLNEYMRMYNSIIICALLHDLGKVGQYDKPLYVENMLKKGRSEAQPYKTNDALMTLDHEIVSIIEASRYIKLTEEEQRAIAWHNGLYSIFKYEIPGKETALQLIIHFADMWASRILETKGADDE